MDKEDVLYAYNKILLSHKKDEILSSVTVWINFEDIVPSETSDRKRQIFMISLIC